MNKHINNRSLTPTRLLVTLALATTLALTTLLGQAAVEKVLGVEATPTLYACQSNGAGC
jgi:hypothetical protein